MKTDTAQEATRIYIAYVQLQDLLSELSKRLEYGVQQQNGRYWGGSASYAKNFNAILKLTREAFKIDEHFLTSIKDIEEVEETLGPTVLEDVLSRGSRLRGTLKAFVSVYMGSEKKAAIGFHVNQ